MYFPFDRMKINAGGAIRKDVRLGDGVPESGVTPGRSRCAVIGFTTPALIEDIACATYDGACEAFALALEWGPAIAVIALFVVLGQ